MVDAIMDAEDDDIVTAGPPNLQYAHFKSRQVAPLVADPVRWNSCHFVVA